MALVGVLLLFLLTLATNNRLAYERNYNWLFTANVVVAIFLLAVLLWGGLRLALRLKRGRFGSKLLLKLAGIFTLVGLVPGLLIYVVSYQFVSRSIESWFDVKVEGALSAGVSLASSTLDTLANDMANNTRLALLVERLPQPGNRSLTCSQRGPVPSNCAICAISGPWPALKALMTMPQCSAALMVLAPQECGRWRWCQTPA